MKLFPNLSFPLFTIAAGVWLCVVPEARAVVYTVTSTADSGPGSLRNAIATANSGDTIVFSSTLAGQTIQLTSGELVIAQNLTIDASSLSGGIVIDGGGNYRVLEISAANVAINTLTVTNGYVADDSGAGVLLDDNTASLIASNCVFCGNSDDGYGGAIFSFGTLTLDNCTVSGNFATVLGGGIFGYGGVVTLNGCTLSGNSVPDGGGGGIESELATLTLNNCTVSSNVASIFGGGVDTEDEGTLAATNCVFLDNSSGTAGALSVETPATVSNCSFSGNISTNGAGGGIVNYATLALNNCTLSGNSVTNNNGTGGGLVNSGMLTMNNCTLSGNSAPNGSGGGMYNWDTLTATNCTVFGNSASENQLGGGICNNSGILVLDNCTLSDNSATNGSGGGLASFDATNVLVNCTVCSNSAIYAGGLFDDGSSTFALTNTIVAGNTTPDSPDIAASYSGVANFVGGNPELAPLGNYGGPTQTMPPEFGSPVINAGTDWVTNVLATDQRGYPRLAGAHVDIGAVEAQIAPAAKRPVLTNVVWIPGGSAGIGAFRFSLTNTVNAADYTVLASTNLALPLAQWTVLGNVPQASQFQFVDQITFITPQQFYRVVSP
jgi:Right handed beta helix region